MRLLVTSVPGPPSDEYGRTKVWLNFVTERAIQKRLQPRALIFAR
jgi:hypothetical protein